MGGDHITKHGTYISRDMGPGGGGGGGGGAISPMIWPHVTREMGPGGPISLLHTCSSELPQVNIVI